jgi:salicylate hydroxylase
LHQEELETWVKVSPVKPDIFMTRLLTSGFEQGRVVLLGDACHPSIPYQAQGVAMALEDGVVLGTLLGSLRESTQVSPEQRGSYIPQMLELYESQRKKHTTLNQQGAISNRTWYQAKDGPEMIHRNDVFRSADGYGSCEWKGDDFEYQKELLGFDAAKVSSEAFNSWERSRTGHADERAAHWSLK